MGQNLISVNVGAKGDSFLKKGGKWGYCNQDGKLVIPLQFDSAETFHEGLAAVKIKRKWGFINLKGELVIQPQYDETSIFQEGLCAVAVKGVWGYINQNNEQVILPQFGDANAFRQGVAVVYLREKTDEDWEDEKGSYCLIDKEGKNLTTAKYKSIDAFTEGLAKVEIADLLDEYATKKGFINLAGQEVIRAIYDDAEHFSEGLAAVGVKDSTKQGSDSDVTAERAYLARINPAYKYGYINTKGEEIIKPQFSSAAAFVHGKAVVGRGKQRRMGGMVITRDNYIINHEEWPSFAMIDTGGNYLLNFDWGNLQLIDSNRILARKKEYEGTGVITMEGRMLLPFQYNNLRYIEPDIFMATEDGGNDEEIVLLDSNNHILLQTDKFAMPLPRFQFGLLSVRTHNLTKSGFINLQGKMLIPDKYDMIWDFEPTDPH